MAWLSKYKHRHPVVMYVLQTFAQLQCKYNATFTFAHLSGVLNVIADAISRDFDVPNGEAIRATLPGQPHTALPAWFENVRALERNQSASQTDIAQRVLRHFVA